MNEVMNKILNYLETIYNNQNLYYGIMLALFVIWLILFVILIKLVLNKKKKSNDKPVIEPIIIGEDVQVESKEDLQELLNKMEEDLQNKENVIKTFEDEQEEKAIISYKELIEASNKNDESEEQVKPEESEQQLDEEKESEQQLEEEKEQELNLDFTIIDSPKKFRNTEFISPVYGRVDNDYQEPSIKQEVEEQPIIETEEQPLHAKQSVDSVDEFLNELKRFRKNLE